MLELLNHRIDILSTCCTSPRAMRSTVSDANHRASSDPMSESTSNLLGEPLSKKPTSGSNERANKRSVRQGVGRAADERK